MRLEDSPFIAYEIDELNVLEEIRLKTEQPENLDDGRDDPPSTAMNLWVDSKVT